jgi:hypothetical protein
MMARSDAVLLEEFWRAAPLPFDDSDFVELEYVTESIEDAWFVASDELLFPEIEEVVPVAAHPLRFPLVLVAIAVVATLVATSI